jgi:hypothetical protein
MFETLGVSEGEEVSVAVKEGWFRRNTRVGVVDVVSVDKGNRAVGL